MIHNVDDFEELSEEELDALDSEIALTPEGAALIRRAALPRTRWQEMQNTDDR